MFPQPPLHVGTFLAFAFLALSSAEGEEKKTAPSPPAEREGVLGTAIGKSREHLQEFGERPKVRARDLPRAVYGNHRARIQEALRQTAVIKDTEKLTRQVGFKLLGPGLVAADSMAGVMGHLSVGEAWSWNPEGKLVHHRFSWWTATFDVEIVLNRDKSISWTSRGTTVTEDRVLVGTPLSPHTHTHDHKGGGTWRFAKERLESQPAPRGAESRIRAGPN